MKRSGLLRKVIGLLSIVAVLYAQSAAAACVCAVMHMDMPNPCAAGAGNAPMTAAQTAPGAMGAHCLNRDMGAPCVCSGHDAGHATVGAPSHPPLAHAVDAALLYIVTDMKTPAASRSVSPAIAPPIRAIPPPHSILHCVFLI